MTLRTRRLAYSAAILIFCLAAPLVVALTFGYRWAGWPPGFVRTSIVVITSQPKAQLLIDGQPRGSTPRRVAGLAPGVHAVRLERPGYGPWQQLINLEPNSARVVGPVTLFPAEFRMAELQTGLTRVLTDRDQTVVVDVQVNALAWQVQQVWPTNQTVAVTLPAQPQDLVRSPHGQVWVFSTARQTEIRFPDKPGLAWAVPPTTQWTWTAGSDQVWFGLRDGQLIRFDGLSQTEENLGPALSLAVSGESVWFTRAGTGTELWRQPTLGQGPAVHVTTVMGDWELQPGNRWWWRNPNTREAEFLTFNTLTRSFGRESFGQVDRMFWSGDQPPVWVDGVNLMTWVNDKPVLLERSSNDYQVIRWLDAPHLLVSVEPTQIAIKSVSLRQGHQTILTAPVSAERWLVWLQPEKQQLVVYARDQQALWLYRWDQPDRSVSR
jgi:hypothetical protein